MNYKSSQNQNDILLSSPIYNFKYHKRTHSQEEQTSATGSISENSIKPNKIKKLKNRVIPSLNIPQNITTLVPNVQIKSRNRVISTPSFIDSLPNISQRSTDEKEKKKDNLFLTTYHIPKDKLIENKIKKIYLKHNLFTNPKKKNNPISPTLSLIKETDLTKKRYYFGFMSETTINSNNNTNSLIKTKRNTSIKSIRNNLSIISKTEGLKKRIDKILNKPNKLIFLKNSKIKLGPLNLINQIKDKRKTSSLNSLLLSTKQNSTRNKRTDSIDFNTAVENIKNNKEILNNKDKDRNIFHTDTNLQNIKKSNLIDSDKKDHLSIKNVNFKLPYILSPKKLDKIIITKKKSTKKFELDLNETSNEHEDSNYDIDSEEEEKRKKKEKEKKKYRARLSSSTLFSPKQLIKFYEYFQFTEQEKKFLMKFHPKKLILKKLLSNSYHDTLLNIKIYMQKKLSIPGKNYIVQFNYNPKMFYSKKKDILEQEIEFEFTDINSIKIYKDNGLNYATSHHLMNLYMPMSPQIIANCISAPEKTMKDCKFLFDESYNFTRRKTCFDVNNLFNIGIMSQADENVIFYQKFIHIDNGIELFQGIIDGNDSDDVDNENSFSKIKSNKNKKKKLKRKKINLRILKKKTFFQMESKERHYNIDSALDNIVKGEDYMIRKSVDIIEKLKEKDILDPNIKSNIFYLLEICIKKQLYDLFVGFYHRYHNFFDINSVDEKHNGDNLLIVAVKEDAQNLVKYLISKGIDLNYTNDFGNTAMHFAISYKNFEIADLLKKSGAREDIENYKGLIPWECINESCE